MQSTLKPCGCPVSLGGAAASPFTSEKDSETEKQYMYMKNIYGSKNISLNKS